ncbi:hypothetical protein C8J56DRAFT_737117, partial [Mycena floridula]
PKKPTATPKKPAPETRLIVQIIPDGIPVDKRPDSYAAILNINRAIQEIAGQSSGDRPEIVTVKWNTKGNAILSVKEGQRAADLVEYGEPISRLLTEKCPPGTTTNIQPDQKWIKLIAHGIRTHTLPFPGESARLFTPDEIHQHLSEQNPSYAALAIVKRPTWIRSEAETMDIPFSSVVFAFADTEENREARSRLRRMAAFGREKHTGVKVTLRTDIVQDRDIQVLDISAPGIDLFTVVHIYHDGTRGRQGMAWQIRSLDLPRDRPVLITGDWNLHHNRWCCGTINNSGFSTEVVDWLEDEGYALKNKKGEITFQPHSAKFSPSVIDLSWTNLEATRNDTFKEWAVDPTLGYGSDHHAIKWTVDPDLHEVNNLTGAKYNYDEADPNKWQAAYSEALLKYEDKLSPLRDPECDISTNELDAAAEAITQAM